MSPQYQIFYQVLLFFSSEITFHPYSYTGCYLAPLHVILKLLHTTLLGGIEFPESHFFSSLVLFPHFARVYPPVVCTKDIRKIKFLILHIPCIEFMIEYYFLSHFKATAQFYFVVSSDALEKPNTVLILHCITCDCFSETLRYFCNHYSDISASSVYAWCLQVMNLFSSSVQISLLRMRCVVDTVSFMVRVGMG